MGLPAHSWPGGQPHHQRQPWGRLKDPAGRPSPGRAHSGSEMVLGRLLGLPEHLPQSPVPRLAPEA
eukprot:4630036-Lingulodinium_polyedra.AAC.1